MRWMIIGAVVVLAGCSTTNEVVDYTPQYCYTNEQIAIENGTEVDSAIRVECTDSQVQRVRQHQVGLAENCGYFTYYMEIGGNVVTRKGISCQRMDGTWEIINTRSGY